MLTLKFKALALKDCSVNELQHQYQNLYKTRKKSHNGLETGRLTQRCEPAFGFWFWLGFWVGFVLRGFPLIYLPYSTFLKSRVFSKKTWHNP